MSDKVVDSACRVELGKLIVVIEGDNPAVVTSPTAKKLAVEKAASLGYRRMGINGLSGGYPVDKDGSTKDQSGNEYDWNEMSKQGLIAKYRCDIKLMGEV